MKVKLLSRVRLFATLWTVARQASPSMGFSRQEYWSGLPFPSPGDLPDPGVEPGSPVLEADALTSEPSFSQTVGRPTAAPSRLPGSAGPVGVARRAPPAVPGTGLGRPLHGVRLWPQLSASA